MSSVILSVLTGFILGFIQSFIVGIFARSWSGGTGCLWGIIIGPVSGVFAYFFDWWGMLFAATLSLIIFASSIGSVLNDRKNNIRS